jgi:hypothetical protein
VPNKLLSTDYPPFGVNQHKCISLLKKVEDPPTGAARAINIVASLRYIFSESKIFTNRPGDPLEIAKFLTAIA